MEVSKRAESRGQRADAMTGKGEGDRFGLGQWVMDKYGLWPSPVDSRIEGSPREDLYSQMDVWAAVTPWRAREQSRGLSKGLGAIPDLPYLSRFFEIFPGLRPLEGWTWQHAVHGCDVGAMFEFVGEGCHCHQLSLERLCKIKDKLVIHTVCRPRP